MGKPQHGQDVTLSFRRATPEDCLVEDRDVNGFGLLVLRASLFAGEHVVGVLGVPGQCLGRRAPSEQTLHQETAAREKERNQQRGR